MWLGWLSKLVKPKPSFPIPLGTRACDEAIEFVEAVRADAGREKCHLKE